MKLLNLVHTVALSSLCLMGCSKGEDTSVAPPPAPAPGGGAVAVNATAPVTTPPTEVAPPPAPSTLAAPSPAAAAEADPKEFKDPDGKTISIMQHMEALVQGYERTRANLASEPDRPQWPPLTDLNQLVNVRMITRLPTAPEGQKFVYDPQTGKVSLAPK